MLGPEENAVEYIPASTTAIAPANSMIDLLFGTDNQNYEAVSGVSGPTGTVLGVPAVVHGINGFDGTPNSEQNLDDLLDELFTSNFSVYDTSNQDRRTTDLPGVSDMQGLGLTRHEVQLHSQSEWTDDSSKDIWTLQTSNVASNITEVPHTSFLVDLPQLSNNLTQRTATVNYMPDPASCTTHLDSPTSVPPNPSPLPVFATGLQTCNYEKTERAILLEQQEGMQIRLAMQ